MARLRARPARASRRWRARRVRGDRRAPPRRPETIADPLVISDLPTLLWSPHRHPRGGCPAGAGAGDADRLDRRARVWTPRSSARAGSPSGPTWWTSRGCARPPGASGWRRRSTRQRMRRRARTRSSACGSATTRPRPSRRCCSSAGSPRAWAGSWAARRSKGAREHDGALRARARGRRADRAAPAGHARAARAGPRRGGAVSESGLRIELDRGPGGCTSAAVSAMARARVDAVGRLARRGRHPRRGHPSGAAARPGLPAGVARRTRDAAQPVAGGGGVTRLTTLADAEAVAKRAALQIARDLSRPGAHGGSRIWRSAGARRRRHVRTAGERAAATGSGSRCGSPMSAASDRRTSRATIASRARRC